MKKKKQPEPMLSLRGRNMQMLKAIEATNMWVDCEVVENIPKKKTEPKVVRATVTGRLENCKDGEWWRVVQTSHSVQVSIAFTIDDSMRIGYDSDRLVVKLYLEQNIHNELEEDEEE